MVTQHNNTKDALVFSYHQLRQAIGVLGIALPLILFVGGMLALSDLRPSISAYFNTVFRDIFVGIMCAIGVFLLAYRGYACDRENGEWVSDRVLSFIAGISAIGIALFPVRRNMCAKGVTDVSVCDVGVQEVETLSQLILGAGIAELFHYGLALAFFVSLIGFSLIKFPRKIYLLSGIILVGVTAGLLATFFLGRNDGAVKASINEAEIVFWLEAIGIWAFGVAWLTKGKADIALRWAARHRRHN